MFPTAIPWKLVGIAAVVLIIGGLAWRCSYLGNKRDEAEKLVAALTSANTDNQAAIKTLRGALAEWRALGVTPEEAAVAVASMNEIQGLAAQLQQAIEKAKETDRAKPNCAAWLDTDFESACPGIARGLRDAAGGANRNRGGAGAGSEAPRPAPHR